MDEEDDGPVAQSVDALDLAVFEAMTPEQQDAVVAVKAEWWGLAVKEQPPTESKPVKEADISDWDGWIGY